MKTHILTFFLLSATFILNAQQFEWAKSFGFNTQDEAKAITTDVNGNIYTTGRVLQNVFVRKMDLTGNFLWEKSFGGIFNDEGWSIEIDISGNIYTTGIFQGTVDFDPGLGSFNLSSNGDYDVFVQKLDSSGNFLWAKSFGGINLDRSFSIKSDFKGDLYILGQYEGSLDFDPGTGIFNLNSIGYHDVFVQKLDSSGNFLWAKSFGGTYIDYSRSMSIDGFGNIYVVGMFKGTSNFDPGLGSFNLSSNGDYDVFVQKLDSSGNFLWAKSFGGIGREYGNSIKSDFFGNVYLIGEFTGQVDFDPGTGIFNLNSIGYHDVFVQKLDSSGNFLWAKSFGGNVYDYGISIDVDSTGNTYSTGLANDSIFIQKTDILGNSQWRKLLISSRANPQAIKIDDSGNIYITGGFRGTMDFDPGVGIYNLMSNTGSSDAFVQKMSQNSTLSLITQIDNSLINLYPNPTSDFVTISLNNKSKGQVIVLDLLGKVVLNKEYNSNQIQLSLKSIESKGTYLVKIMDSNGNVIANKKLIYQ